MFCKNFALKNFTKFTGKHLCQNLFFNKVAVPETLLKKRFWHRCFHLNFVKFLRTSFLQKTSGSWKKPLKHPLSSENNLILCNRLFVVFTLDGQIGRKTFVFCHFASSILHPVQRHKNTMSVGYW